jgi:hypothetical protein
VAALPNAHKAWRSDLYCPEPLGRAAPYPLVSFSTPLQNHAHRGNLVTACHLGLANASTSGQVFLPHRIHVEELSDDGDSFAMALHATSLAQWANGVRGMVPALKQKPFAAFGIAGMNSWRSTAVAGAVCMLVPAQSHRNLLSCAHRFQ